MKVLTEILGSDSPIFAATFRPSLPSSAAALATGPTPAAGRYSREADPELPNGIRLCGTREACPVPRGHFVCTQFQFRVVYSHTEWFVLIQWEEYVLCRVLLQKKHCTRTQQPRCPTHQHQCTTHPLATAQPALPCPPWMAVRPEGCSTLSCCQGAASCLVQM